MAVITSVRAFDQYCGSRVLVTGGLGFIGSNLAEALLELGAKVTVIDNLHPLHGGNIHNIVNIKDRLTLIKGDATNLDLMCELVEGKEFIFNLVGQSSHIDSMENPYDDISANCSAPLCVLNACLKTNPDVHIVYSSTRQVYGVPKYLPVDESHPVQPVDINGANKLAAEFYHQVYSRAYGIKSCVLRLTNTYGPKMRIRDARQNFLGYWIGEVLSGNYLKIYGDGSQKRDFNYIDDVVDALLLSMINEAAYGKVINLGGGPTHSLKQVAEVLCSTAGISDWKLEAFPETRKAIDIGDYYSDITLAQNILDWSPQVSLEKGLAKSVEYFQDWLKEYRDEK